MVQTEVTGKDLNKITKLYSFTDYFGYDTDYKLISEVDIEFQFVNFPVEIINQSDLNGNFLEAKFKEDSQIILKFNNEEDALYFKLKYC